MKDIEKDDSDIAEIVKIRVDGVIQDKKRGKLTKTGLKVPSKMGYAKNIKAVLFGVFTREFKINLADPLAFPQHFDWWQRYTKWLKKEGRGTIKYKSKLHKKFNEDSMFLAHHCLQVKNILEILDTN